MVAVFVNDRGVSPLVTIALPLYNGAQTLRQSVQSLLDQTYKNIELIVIDDGSNDNSLELMESFDDSRIKVVKNKSNLGLSASLNKVVGMATGKYFARMDQDDISLPNRIEKQVDYMLENPGVDLLATATYIFNEEYNVLGVLPVKTKHDDICASPLKGFYMPHPTWLGKTEWFKANRYKSEADGAEDQNLLFRTYRKSKFACLRDPLLLYREPKRSFKKMFRARRIFAKSNGNFEWKNNNKVNSFVLVLIQAVKLVGDFLNIIVSVGFMRNKLIDLDDADYSDWMRAMGLHKASKIK